MPDPPPELGLPDGRIDFGGGRIAIAVRPRPDAKPAETIASLGLKAPRLVIALIGGADDYEPGPRRSIQHLCAHAIVPAAVEGGAAIVDGGTRAGIMAAMGEAVAEYPGDRPPLLGIAPEALVSYPGKPPGARRRRRRRPRRQSLPLRADRGGAVGQWPARRLRPGGCAGRRQSGRRHPRERRGQHAGSSSRPCVATCR